MLYYSNSFLNGFVLTSTIFTILQLGTYLPTHCRSAAHYTQPQNNNTLALNSVCIIESKANFCKSVF